MTTNSALAAVPSVGRLLDHESTRPLIAQYGRPAVVEACRAVLAQVRTAAAVEAISAALPDGLIERVAARLAAEARPTLRPVFNLTGTIIHTNLGRAPLPQEAIDAMAAVARGPVNLEFDLDEGRRGDRDAHVEALLCRLTGAEAATVVNNNAAAVLLVLNTLALRKEVPTSRGELVEIGGSFRMPEIMARAGCRLREVGTTNRVHIQDYTEALGPKTGTVLRVHPSNFAVVGFTARVPDADLARACHEHAVPFVVDLGSGSLVDLRRFGLPHEATPQDALAQGADVVTFSGDKLLGGPQAGLIVGRREIVSRLRRNPLKRALRVDKLTLAALAAVLQLYTDPDRLATRLPVVRLLARPHADILASAERLRPAMAQALGAHADVSVTDCDSQAGSGSLPTETLRSAGLAVTTRGGRQRSGPSLTGIAAALRRLPIPVLGRITEDALILDVRALEDEATFLAQLPLLTRLLVAHD